MKIEKICEDCKECFACDEYKNQSCDGHAVCPRCMEQYDTLPGIDYQKCVGVYSEILVMPDSTLRVRGKYAAV